MTQSYIVAPLETARSEIADLKRALQHQIKLTEQQRLRADLAEASRDQAWRMAAVYRVPVLQPKANEDKMRDS